MLHILFVLTVMQRFDEAKVELFVVSIFSH